MSRSICAPTAHYLAGAAAGAAAGAFAGAGAGSEPAANAARTAAKILAIFSFVLTYPSPFFFEWISLPLTEISSQPVASTVPSYENFNADLRSLNSSRIAA